MCIHNKAHTQDPSFIVGDCLKPSNIYIVMKIKRKKNCHCFIFFGFNQAVVSVIEINLRMINYRICDCFNSAGNEFNFVLNEVALNSKKIDVHFYKYPNCSRANL